MKAMGAFLPRLKMPMTPPKSSWITTSLAAAAAALAFQLPALAQTSTHDHHAAPSHKLTLNQGQKWATDAPLRTGISRIRALVESQLAAAHAGKLTPAQYRELATQVEVEVGGIVSSCKLEPKADSMLHIVIADIGAGTDAMAGKDTGTRPALGLVKVAEGLNRYGSHFDPPGFKPIRNMH